MKKLALTITIISLLISSAPQALAKEYNVSAWLPSWETEEAFQSFQNNADTINTISPFWYHLNEDGTLVPPKDGEDITLIEFAHENNIPIIPTISNSFNGDTVAAIVNDPEIKKQNIQIISDLIRKYNYDGIDIDYEGLHSEDKNAFTAYIRDLREELNHYNKKLTIAIQAKSYPALLKYGDRGQDWKALSQYVDEFRIMTYDYGWSGSIPRPVAPYYWVEEVIEYAVDNVPREKIYVGIPFYGYGWSEDYFSSYTYDTIELILSKYSVDFQYDPETKTNRLFYISEFDEREPPVPHEVWFENHVSLEPKLELVKKYDLGGIAIWRLGKEDEMNWRVIKQILKDQPIGPKLYFKDVSINTIFNEAITLLAKLGIVTGQGTTLEFMPLDKVNRAEILKMALNSFARDTSKYYFEETRGEDFVNPFKDTGEAEWYFPYILSAVDFGMVQGYPDGTFKPDQKILRVEALKLALKSAGIAIGRPGVGENWYEPYVDWAVNNRLYNGVGFVAEEEISRAEAAYIIAEVVERVE
ncbi:glycosyl hydrolase family 18 protein [Patescibacteria group bacterium]